MQSKISIVVAESGVNSEMNINLIQNGGVIELPPRWISEVLLDRFTHSIHILGAVPYKHTARVIVTGAEPQEMCADNGMVMCTFKPGETLFDLMLTTTTFKDEDNRPPEGAEVTIEVMNGDEVVETIVFSMKVVTA